MPPWFLPTAFTVLAWGLWAFFVKIATAHLSWKAVYAYELIGILLVTIISFFFTGIPKEYHPKGVFFAVLAGICIMIGEPLFVIAVNKGKASIVTVFVALYPLLTVVLATLILREALTIRQGIGIVFALAAIVLFAA